MDIDKKFERFKDAPWFTATEKPVFIGGSGGIGSWLSLFLARANFKVFITDFDRVEEQNLGGQFFKLTDISKHKVSAVEENIRMFSGQYISTFTDKVVKGSLCLPLCFSAFDNMEARRSLFENWKKLENEDKIFIDGRLEAEQLQIFCVTPDKIEEYEKTLFSDEGAEAPSCTLKQTSHVAAMIAAKMTGFFTNYISNIELETEVREVPFYYEYFIPLNLTVNDLEEDF